MVPASPFSTEDALDPLVKTPTQRPLTWIMNETCALDLATCPVLTAEPYKSYQEDNIQPSDGESVEAEEEQLNDTEVISCERNEELMTMPTLAPCLEVVDAKTLYFFEYCK